MAKRLVKRLVKWSLSGGILMLSKALEDPKAVAVIEAEFDLRLLYKDFESFNEVQQQLVVFGVKQKLMDAGASDIGDGMTKIQSAKAKWNELLEGKWSGERANGTGAAENKRIVSEIKELRKTKTLFGLMAKKITDEKNFTQEDEEDLQRFLEIAAEENKKQKKAGK